MHPAESKLETAWLFIKLAIFTVVAPGSLTVWVPFYWLRPRLRNEGDFFTLTGVFGGVVLATGIAGYFWCALDFLFQGRGTPAPIDAPKIVVRRGLYRYSRNPMYSSVLLVIVGECLVFRSWFLLKYAGFVALIFHFWVMIYEEPTLRRNMGDSYLQYCEKVPRWIPRLGAGKSGHAV